MFKKKEIEELKEKLKSMLPTYNSAVKEVNEVGFDNYKIKYDLAEDLIAKTDRLLSRIVAIPVKYILILEEYKSAFQNFKNIEEECSIELEEHSYKP